MNVSILELLVGLYAPHRCIGCNVEGQLVCSECLEAVPPHPEICYMCHRLSPGYRTCIRCKEQSALSSVRITTLYEGVIHSAIHRLKFERAGAVAIPLGRLLANNVNSPSVDVVIPVPAASSRYRQRGYNPAELLAKQVGHELNRPLVPALVRVGQKRQLGSKRQTRLEQIKGTVLVSRVKAVQNKRILLIDDVVTTGATVAECGQVLKAAGAAEINAVVLARHHT